MLRVRLILICLLAFARAAAAQAPTGSIDGVIVDSSGAVMPGVTVVLTHDPTGVAREVVSDAQGVFRAPLLPVGPYTLKASMSGFQPVETQILIAIGQAVSTRLEMKTGTIAESVTVRAPISASTPSVETTRSQMSSTISENSVANLPVNGRNFIDFALLTPGVTRDVRTGDISFAGQRGTLNSLVVDGADTNNTFFGQTLGRTGSGRAPYQFSQDAVQEFQVNSSAYSAEYGRAGGAVINVVTKSGTNTPHGTLFDFYRDKALNANDAINVLNNRPKSPYHYNQFGGSYGGPLQKFKHFLFANYDGQRNTQPNDVFITLPPGTSLDPTGMAGLASVNALAGSWTRGQDQDVFLVKTDSQLTPDRRLSVRYNHQNFTGKNFETSGPQNALEHTGDSKVRTRTLNATFTHGLGSTMLNEARAQWARDQEPGFANSENPEAIVRQGGSTILTIGRNNFSPRETTISRGQFADTVTWLRGAHFAKMGADFNFDRILNFFPGNFGGSYQFNSLSSFEIGTPNAAGERYLQAFAGPGTTGATTHPDINEYSVFIQDEWRARTDLSVHAGVRYDVQKFARPSVRNPDAQLAGAGIDTSTLNTDGNNWGPRLGLAWSPGAKKYVVRAGYGIFYGRTPSIMVGTAHSNNGINVQTITFTGALVPTYPATFSGIPAGATLPKPTIFVFDQDYENPRVQQASTGVEYALSQRTSLAVNYLFVHGDQLSRSTDINIGAAAPATFTVAETGQALPHYRFGAGPFVNFARIISFQSSAVSTYHGLTIEANRRFGALQARAAYTVGKVTDTVPDATAVVPGTDDAKFASNPADFEADRAPGNNDQRQRLVVSGVYASSIKDHGMLAGGWTVAAIVTAQSGQPYSAYVSNDINLDQNTRNDIAPGTARNQYRLPSQVTFDPRIARDIPAGKATVQLIWEAFNLFNRDNISGVRNTLYNVSGTTLTTLTNFQQPTLSSGPRIMQLAVKLRF
ncbi:MAG TPA: carboxypeptidase regulatory-like domain-containing protein [Vicinamibacterales bacterium]|nr:carboxypeptidase regulatory-like domain-containing protein [Vicinamibacterales bacterium]